ncbi:MAG: hypothetical protein HOP37_01510 [Cyclobacteriaceae bacterium]|nr:hypothetical protein [Cyclobacteriaceae bacterium]
MKPILYSLLFLIVLSCAPGTKEKDQQDSVAQTTDTVVVNRNLNPAFATAPDFRTHSKKVYTEDERESVIITSLDSLFAHYLKQKYFSIASETFEKKSWHLDENKQLRIITTERENETVNENSIYLFNKGKLIAYYRDVDMDGQDTQRNRERIAMNKCPDCGVRFDVTSSQIVVNTVEEARVNELASYINQDYKEVLDWITQAPIRSIVGSNCIFERGSPNNARYIVNMELYSKFIKNINR